ncbi:uncharacterized protein LOC100874666 isoform X3 [Megachile rotundata]|uniref:uncharacterized protein LOC100874666 isoform X3 n=1 Tax=Megachile rotundata TaxID=143995 RepID=UPI000614C6F2|nr:PREDICTED: zinc finger protein 385B-like isoform X4 [Megachile rotundata]
MAATIFRDRHLYTLPQTHVPKYRPTILANFSNWLSFFKPRILRSTTTDTGHRKPLIGSICFKASFTCLILCIISLTNCFRSKNFISRQWKQLLANSVVTIMAVSTESIMTTSLNDPVTKAVMDNIMGNLPTKKPLVRCDDCDLSFTSQTVLDTHLQGARHAKQMRSKNIMASLEETKVSFTKDEETNGLKCNVCNVCLNSIQQLQTHLNGSRHKKKAMRGEWDGKEFGNSMTPTTTNVQENSGSKSTSLSCNMCNKIFNSPAQYNVMSGD